MCMVLQQAIGKTANAAIDGPRHAFVYLKRFEVNLTNSRGDVLLHVNPRVNDRQLILNAAPGGAWGAEERHPWRIPRGDQFTLIIMVAEQGFKVKNSANGESA